MTFKWDSYFETGVEIIDQQHQGLVALINECAPFLTDTEQPDFARMDLLLDQLFAYAAMHFKTEEGLMVSHGVDPRYYKHHGAAHTLFVEQLTDMRAEVASQSVSLAGPNLLKFLTSWLTIHILDEDQRLARHLDLLASGASAVDAFQTVSAKVRATDPARAALESALIELYTLLGERNKVLQTVNQALEQSRNQLEQRVQERTQELSAALEQTKAAQAQLLQSEKMAAIGQLAAGVAHEINNPIGFVNSNLGTLKGYVHQLLSVIDAYEGLDSEVSPLHPARQRIERAIADADLIFLRKDISDLLDESMSGLGRVKKIVQDLKDFSHVDQSDWQDVDLNVGLESTLNVIANEIKYKARVNKTFGLLPQLRCVPAQLNQVFMNLLINAAQAMEGKQEMGRIDVATGADDDAVWVEIRDNGGGMPDDVRRRIFEPFYTTKPVGKGTGLGLSISYDIVTKKHGGRIEVESVTGAGSTFRVVLPRQPNESVLMVQG
ncbi:MAG TPA: bacteriohemerythrin [Rhodoferax sp.]|nr:bacteriohemerythrin [Rhodoferax sp.]